MAAAHASTDDRPDGREGRLRARRLGLHTHGEAVAIVRRDSPFSRREGLAAHAQVELEGAAGRIRADLFHVEDGVLGDDEIGLSETAWTRLSATDGEPLLVAHAPRLESMSCVRHRIHGGRLSREALRQIVADIVAGNYAEVHLAAFLTATSALPLDDDEVFSLTEAMVETGQRLEWDAPVVVDKHSLGGLPGNRTTPIVVPIVAACGLVMPKTSSRAITSPAGTADTMEVMAPVELDLAAIRKVVAATGGCVAWGGAVNLSPADDIFIRVERMLDVDTEGQLIASVLSKKIAAGATHVVIDIPIGPTAKIRSAAAGETIARRLQAIADRFGVGIVCMPGDGSQPIGRGIGPALEARDVLAVLRGEAGAPQDLRHRACALAGAVLEVGGAASAGAGKALALKTLESGDAWRKFQAICAAQGGFREPGEARIRRPIPASHSGRILHIDNRRIAQLAKLAGAPEVQTAGLAIEVRLGDEVIQGQPLATLHAANEADADYAMAYALGAADMIGIG